MNKIDEMEKRIKKLESFHDERNSPETFVAISRSVASGTADLMEELQIFKMKLENNEINIFKLIKKNKEMKDKINEIVRRVNEYEPKRKYTE